MAINPDDMKAGFSYFGRDEGGFYRDGSEGKTYIPDFKNMRKRGEDESPITDMLDRTADRLPQTTFPLPNLPDFPALRPPRRPQNPTSGGRFVNDYSFLNLPAPGSAVRSPIEIAQESLPPSVLQQIDFSSPQELPQADLLTRGGTPQIIPTRPQGILGTQNFQNILQTAVGNAEAEIQMLREAKIDLTNQYEQAVVQQDAITAQAAEDQLAAVNAKEQELLTERANIIQELEEGFGVEREGLQTNIANLEGTVTDLQANIDALTQERDAAIAEQDVIRSTAAEEQAKALAEQKADLQGQIDTLSASQTAAAGTTTAEMPTPPADTYNPNYMGFEDERMIGRQDEMMAAPPVQQQAFPLTGQDLGLSRQELPVTNPNIPTDIVSQLQNMNIQRPNLNFNNLRTGMAGGGDINKIEILLKRLG